MPLLACTIQRKESILCAHRGVCMYVCVACGCVDMCIHIHLCQCIQNGGYKSTSISTCSNNHTSTIEQLCHCNCSLFAEGLARGQVPVLVKYSKC